LFDGEIISDKYEMKMNEDGIDRIKPLRGTGAWCGLRV
jgi:hypothetical protein